MDSAFSVEISNMIPEGSDWNEARPYKFLCGSIAIGTAKEFGGVHTYWDVETLCDDLYELSERGRLYSWNGVGFDFLALHDSGIALKKTLVLNHYDMMFDIYCHAGFPISLISVLKGFNFFRDAERLEYSKEHFQEYLSRFSNCMIQEHSQLKTSLILKVAKHALDVGGIAWVSQSDRIHWSVFDTFMTVQECMKIEFPETKWMKHEPLSKQRFLGWMGVV